MFDFFGNDSKDDDTNLGVGLDADLGGWGGHDDTVEELETSLTDAGFNTRADHIEDDQPSEINGRVPDLGFDHPGPGETYVEVDSNSTMTGHDRKQTRDIRQGIDEEDRFYRVTPEGSSRVDEQDDFLDF